MSHQDDFADLSLVPASLVDDIVAAIPGSLKHQMLYNDLSPTGDLEVSGFPCPFARERDCDPRAIHYTDASGWWRFACKYPCQHEEFIPALAEAYPTFAELMRRYGVEDGSPQWSVQVCRELRIPLRLGADGILSVCAPIPAQCPNLKAALETHCEAIATIIANWRTSLADATEYVDPEFPCDYAAMDADSGELTASCATKTHSEEEITERWAEIANAARNEGEPN